MGLSRASIGYMRYLPSSPAMYLEQVRPATRPKTTQSRSELPPRRLFPDEPFYVAIITPVIHYCMGGLLTSPDGEVIAKKDSKPLPGLFVAGEAAGGVHGNNRLGGNSLLDCVVFGRVAGRSCSKYIAGADG